MRTLAAGRRLAPQRAEVIDRATSVPFTWNGQTHLAFAGDTIASALAASGVRVISRSFKYHRPRGILTATFNDPGCMVQVGDEPNVRGAHRLVEPGMDVRAQNVWPSLAFDLRAANRFVARFLSPGFYYKTFMKPTWLWPAYQRTLKRFAAGGRVYLDSPHGYYDQRYAHPDVLVAGGGPAGIAAAIAAARSGASVMLVEEEYQLGGHLRWGDTKELTVLDDLRRQIEREPAIEVLVNSVVTGRYDDNWIAVIQRESPEWRRAEERLIRARAKSLVIAPGLIERPYIFEGNDLPGVMLSTAVRRLIKLWSVRPGERAVIFTGNADGDAAVRDLEGAGVDVAAVIDAWQGGDLVRASGGRSVRSIEVGDGRRLECDLVVIAVGWTAPTALLNMAGDRPVYEPRAARFVPGQLPGGVFAAGGLAGDGSLDQLMEHATEVGRAAAIFATRNDVVPVPRLLLRKSPELFRSHTHGFIDLAEDVSSKDILAAKKEGYDSIELIKRFTTVTMGSTQGKLETVNAVAVLAEATGQTIAETGFTAWRPPYAPISLGALAGRGYEPVRYSPIQPWHEARGAIPMVAGQWIRPDHYGDAAAEVMSVRTCIGLIDVTPLGKLDLRGPDVPKLLNLLYVNGWSKLEIGSVRYGLMCGEDGVVLDDGVTGRLGPEHYLMTTTSSGAAAVWEWVENWLQTEHSGWRVHVTPVTGSYASMNLAGPRSRELMGRVVEGVDLSPEVFPYMRVRVGRVAGVDDCFMWRIGFTGELSYEIHVPASYGLHVWEVLMHHGTDLGIAPFGVEAQRILRLEKGHLIVGQDTDALTQAFAIGLDKMIKLDKEDFVGKPELVWQRTRGVSSRLVGLQPIDPSVVPPEGCQIVEGANQIVGRITSSRMSPSLNRSICLGFVADRLADPGTIVSAQLPAGDRVPVKVMEHHAHVDPAGERLRG